MKRLKIAVNRIRSDLKKIIWIFPAVGLYFILLYVLLGTICPIKGLTGIPCPGCGMTRALFYLLTGRFALSFEMHPLLIPWLLFFLYLFISYYVLNKKPRGIWVILTLLCIAMLILYGYRMYTWFPTREPMTYGFVNYRRLW